VSPLVLKVVTGDEPAVIEAFTRALSTGAVAGIPTDTVYGLAGDPRSEAAVQAIFEMKGRDAGKALPVLAGSWESLRSLGVEINPRQESFLRRYWPGPLTAVLRLRTTLPASGGEQTLAVRLPAAGWLQKLLEGTGPVTATSANLSGRPAARSAMEVVAALGPALGLVLDGGPSVESRPSTLLDLGGAAPRILREGPVFVDLTLF
jgi:tRNA threonylcarbamoyl adenosine modification protein (Sua5/YciO/YrdC/YwlC family)